MIFPWKQQLTVARQKEKNKKGGVAGGELKHRNHRKPSPPPQVTKKAQGQHVFAKVHAFAVISARHARPIAFQVVYCLRRPPCGQTHDPKRRGPGPQPAGLGEGVKGSKQVGRSSDAVMQARSSSDNTRACLCRRANAGGPQNTYQCIASRQWGQWVLMTPSSHRFGLSIQGR